jgi:hypothetical protein
MDLPKPDEPMPRPPQQRQTALSPVGEMMGDTIQTKHDVDGEKILTETALEVASNY